MRQILALPVLLFVLSGCGIKTFVIPNLGSLVTQRLNGYFDLGSQEKKQLKSEVNQFLESSKTEFMKLKTRLEKMDIKTADMKKEFQFFGETYFELAKKFSPILATEIVKLNGEKKEEFYKSLQEKNEEIQEKSQKRDLDHYKKRYEFFFGDLDEKQLLMVKKSLPLLKNLGKQRLIRRKTTQEQMKNVLVNSPNESRVADMTKIFVESSDRRRPDSNREAIANNIQALVDTLSDEQMASFNKRRLQIIDYLQSFLDNSYI